MATKSPTEKSTTPTPASGIEAAVTSRPAATSSLPVPVPTATIESAKLPPPKPSDVNDAVGRIFEKTASTVKTEAPIAVVGDFNGDGSEDLAVVIRANNGMLSEINSEVANWTLEDPAKVAIPGSRQTQTLPLNTPVRAVDGELLLAIVHGIGSEGWRSNGARQTYLLKNGAAVNLSTESARSLRDIRNKQTLPPLRGDAIRESLAGRSGLIVWTGARYAWFSLAREQ